MADSISLGLSVRLLGMFGRIERAVSLTQAPARVECYLGVRLVVNVVVSRPSVVSPRKRKEKLEGERQQAGREGDQRKKRKHTKAKHSPYINPSPPL